MPSLLCHHCQKPFEKSQSLIDSHQRAGLSRHYCSRRCAAIVNNTNANRNPAKNRVCHRCDKSFKAEKGHPSRKACPDCYRNREYVSLMTIAEIESTNTSEERRDKYGRIRANCRTVNKALTELPCAECGYDKHVEICHIRAISQWPKDTLVKDVNARLNVVQLCPTHHWEFDNGLLKVVQPAGLEPAT